MEQRSDEADALLLRERSAAATVALAIGSAANAVRTANNAAELAGAVLALHSFMLRWLIATKVVDESAMKRFLASMIEDLTPAEVNGPQGHCLKQMLLSLDPEQQLELEAAHAKGLN